MPSASTPSTLTFTSLASLQNIDVSGFTGTTAATVKVTPFSEYPPKGRATGGVRCQRFLKGEDGLIQAWIGPPPILAATESGVMVDLTDMQGRRDGSGTALTRQLAYLGPAYHTP